MADSDTVMSGFLIATFTTAGLFMISFCVRRCRSGSQLKQSSSQTDLTSMVVDDPQQT